VWLLAVGAADRRMIARVSSFAISDRTGVISGRMVLGADRADVVASGTPLGGVPKLLTFVALRSGAEGDVFGDVALAVEQREACCTERLPCHFTYEGSDHGRGLFTQTAVWAGEPTWCLTHSERGVGGFDFVTDGFGGSSSGDAMDDEAGPSLANPGRGDWVFVERIFENCEVWFIVGTKMLGRDREDEVVCGSDVCQDERWVGDVGVVGNDLVDDLEGAVGSLPAVVWCRCQVKDNQSVRCWVRLR
jgi:hypothetical protein